MNHETTKLGLSLDQTAAQPYYRQIYGRILGAIASGVLKPGDRIPSARALTQELGLARGTIEAAYSLLAAEGYIQARGQAGTIVTPGLKLRARAPSAPTRAQAIAPPSFRPDSVLPFQMGLPALDAFPGRSGRAWEHDPCDPCSPPTLAHPSVFGLDRLRAQIAAYLQVARGIELFPVARSS